MIGFGERAEPAVQRHHIAWRRWVPVAVAGLDVIGMYCAFALAYFVRYRLAIGPQIQQQLPFSAYQPVALMLIVLMLPILTVKGAYRFRMSPELLDEFGTIFSTATISVAAIVVITAMLHQWGYSRGVIVYLWILLTLLLSVGGGFYHSLQALCYRHGWGVRRLVVVGATDVGKLVMQSVMGRRDLGYRLVGFVAQHGSTGTQDFGRFRALGTVADIGPLVQSGAVDEIIIALPASSHEDVAPLLQLCEEHGVGFKLVPDLFEMSLSRVRIDALAGIPVLDVQEKPLRWTARAMKRAMDVVGASCLLLLSGPLTLVIALLIRLESEGPVLIRQERAGVRGRLFRCIKFRTMQHGAEEMQPLLMHLNETGGPTFKMRHDPRVTRLGRWMRQWSVDELPQAWNVLRGEMSLVGPRPPLPQEVDLYEPQHYRRFDVKPGMTGLWQVSGRSDLPFEEMVLMDSYYVENWSLGLDLKILVRTMIAVLARQGAY
jgi:exopolysaccharide biosynthesis polyprenyl glycosylphosphotransferase